VSTNTASLAAINARGFLSASASRTAFSLTPVKFAYGLGKAIVATDKRRPLRQVPVIRRTGPGSVRSKLGLPVVA